MGGLVSHVRKSHRKEITEVPNAIEGRKSLEVEISAMQGIPEEALNEFLEQLAKEEQAGMPEPEPPAIEFKLPSSVSAQITNSVEKASTEGPDASAGAPSLSRLAQLTNRLLGQGPTLNAPESF